MERTVINLEEFGKRAKAASRVLGIKSTKEKNRALHTIADALLDNQAQVLDANEEDVSAGEAAGMEAYFLDRLRLTPERIAGIAADARKVAELHDPVGEILDERTLANGLHLSRKRTPLGVIGVIYEARPNVTIDIAALALKTGNAAILRGGSETLRSNLVLIDVVQQGMRAADLPEDSFLYISDPDRRHVFDLLKLDKYVDMIIPRGGAGLHRFALENSTIPVITGGIGVCHLFVDETADFDMALKVIQNAKVQRPSVCNALDTALVHRDIAEVFIPKMVDQLAKDKVAFKADEQSLNIIGNRGDVEAAGPDDWETEWLGLTLGIKVVDDLHEAIDHIEMHSTHHSDGILTQNDDHAQMFINGVDSAAVFVNASTRFNDGGQFGLGAEVAVSTQKLHARGPVALDGLTTYKWVVVGDGQVRS